MIWRCLLTMAAFMSLSLVGGGFQAARANDATAALVEEPAVEESRAIQAQTGQAEALITRLRTLVEKEPDNQSTLEELAIAYYQNGEYHNADLTYTRLLKFKLNDPALALPYAMTKWHLRQEYEAQATIIRLLKSVKLSPGNVKQLQATLAECYNPEGLTEALKPEFPNAEELAALERLGALIREIFAETRRLEISRDEAGLAEHISRNFGHRASTRSFYALWRCFALVHGNDLDGAEMVLRLTRPSDEDSRLEADVLTAANLLADLRKESDSDELGKTITDFLSNASSAIGVSASEAEASVSTLLNEAGQLLDQRRPSEAAATLDRVRPLLAKNEDKILYLYLHGEALWPLAEYTRANQAFVASSVMLRDRYFISTAIFRMGEYAAMLNRREEAAQYAIRSAGILREDSWVLRRTGLFLLNLDMTERSLAYLERALEMSDTLQSDADCYSALADAYKRMNERDKFLENARRYVETINRIIAQNGDYTEHQRGLAAFYQGEILASEEKFKEANDSYEAASTLLTEPYRLAETYIIMAEYQAAGGHIDRAESLAVKSADLLPGDAWKARQVGGFLVRLGKRSQAEHYLEKALDLSFSVRERAYSEAALADASLTWRDIPRFLHYADDYIALVKMNRGQLTDADEGLAAFFQGEIYHHQGFRDRAYKQYERATELLDDRFKRSEAWMRMADDQAVGGALEEAAALADKSADELLDQGWKMGLVGNFFMRYGLYGKAEEYYSRYRRRSRAQGLLPGGDRLLSP